MGEVAAEVRGAVKRYGSVTALAGVDLAVRRGRTTVLLGPSGCGKSTLLKLLNGLVFPDEGAVFFEGTQLSPANVLALRRRMGYVLQEGGLFPHLTAGRNVSLLARYLGWERKEIEDRLRALADLVKLPLELFDRYPIELSGGQRQRVSLVRALFLDPELLLLDEPLGALDPLIRSELQEDLQRVFRSLRRTVVLVTHDIAEAGFLGDRIVLLREGKIVQQGTLEDLVLRPADAFVERFVRAQRSPLADFQAGGKS